jgi:hypothetical protein
VPTLLQHLSINFLRLKSFLLIYLSAGDNQIEHCDRYLSLLKLIERNEQVSVGLEKLPKECHPSISPFLATDSPITEDVSAISF